MRKKIIQLPKPHLSYSQIQLWKHDPERYKRIYFDNDERYKLHNQGLEYGKVVATALENEEETGELLTDSAMLLLPKYDVRDKEINVEIKSKYGSFQVLGRPDTLNSVTKDFREYKTGKGKWTAGKAQKHPQMIFYAMLIYLKYKVALKNAYLDWIETESKEELWSDADSGIEIIEKITRPTGRIESFEVTFTLKDILNCISDTIKVAKEIELAYASYDPLI